MCMNSMIKSIISSSLKQHDWNICPGNTLHFTVENKILECEEFINSNETPQVREALATTLQKCFDFVDNLSEVGEWELYATNEPLAFQWTTILYKGTIFPVDGIGWVVAVIP